MARVKKQVEEIEELPEEFEPEPQEPPPIMVKTREYREYVAPMPIAPTTTPAQPEPELVQVVEELPSYYPPLPYAEPEQQPAIDPIESLLAEIGGASHAWTMTIYRLPNYDRDGNGSLKAKKILCGTQPFDSNFEEVIQSLYARHDKPNNFLVCVRRDSRIHRILPVVAIEPIANDERPTTQQSQRDNAISTAIVAPPADPLDALKKQAEVFRELKKIFSDDKPREPQQPAMTGNALELTPESAMLKLLEVEPAKLEAVRSRIFGNGEQSNSSEWVGLVKELLPFILPLLAGMAQKFTAPQPQQAMQPQEQIAPQQLPTQPPPQLRKYQYLIQRILYGIENGLMPNFVGEEIDMAASEDPVLEQMLSGILGADANLLHAQFSALSPALEQQIGIRAADAARVMALPNAKEWLSGLQAYFMQEEYDESAQPDGNAG